MKKVHPASMVAHLWANQSQDDARTAGQNFWFTGAKLYSYGNHYIVGYISEWRNEHGQKVVLRNASRYSNTTAKHNCEANYALRGHDVEQFYLGELTDSMLHSRTMTRNVCDQCEADINAALSRAAGFRSVDKINRELNAAVDARRLMHIIADDSATDKADKKAIYKQIKNLPAIPMESTREAMKPLRDELLKAQARKERERYAQLCADRVANVLGWCDANGIAAPSLDIKPSTSIYTRRAYDAYNHALVALEDRQKAQHYAKKAGLSAPRMPSEKVIRELIATLAPRAQYERHEDEANTAKRKIYEYHRTRRGLGRYRNNTPSDCKESSVLNIGRENFLTLRDGDLDAYAPEHRAAIERAYSLYEKGKRGAAIHCLKSMIESIKHHIESADSYLSQWPKDAAREYRRAIGEYKRARADIIALGETNANASRWLSDQLPDGSIAKAGAWLEDWTAKEAERNAAFLAEWRAGQHSMTSARECCDYPMLRVNQDAERIETSWGAQMPIGHARAVWIAVQYAKRKGEDWTSPPNESVKMGMFTLTRARVDGSIVAGCHDIPASEVEAIARAVGLLD